MPGFNKLSFHLHMDKKQSHTLYIQTACEVIKGSYKNMMHKEFSAALNLCLSFLLSVLSDFLCMVCSLYPFVLIHTTIIIVYLVFFILFILRLNVLVNIAHLVCLYLKIFCVAGPSVFIVQFFCREV